MGQKLYKRETVSIEEAIHIEMIINQAMIDLLVEKGIITHQELMDAIERIKERIPNKEYT